MRIISIDASRANREKKTGTEWYSYHLIQHLKKISSMPGDVFFYLYSHNPLEKELGNLPQNWKNKVLKWPFKYLWTQIRLTWEILIDPPDLLFVPAHCLPWFKRKKFVLVIHDLGFKRFPQAYSFIQRFYYNLVHWAGTKQADLIITPSEFTKKELIQVYHILPSKIKVIPLAYNQQIYSLVKNKEFSDQILTKYQVKQPFLLYVGRIERKKNLVNLIKALQLLVKTEIYRQKPVELILVGEQGNGYQEIEKEIKQTKAIVRQLGYLDQQELACLYQSAEAFIFPSWYEGFGIPVLEAMACGCPILASQAGSLPEIGGSTALYFDPAQPIEIKNKIELLLKSPSQQAELISKGLKRVEQFSWEKTAKETLDAFLGQF